MARFRLAFCQIEILRKKRNVPELYESLNHLPETIEESYEMIFSEIAKDDWPLARAILLWICANDKLPGGAPIPVNTLCSMMSEESSDTTGANLKYTRDEVKEICGCLIDIVWYNDKNIPDRSDTDDESSDTDKESLLTKEGFYSARLAHYTVVEYLFSDRIRQGKAAYFALSEDDTIESFLGPVLETAVKTDVCSIAIDYWNGMESYCARAAWLAPFVWESKIVQTENFWTASTTIWLTNETYFKRMGTLLGRYWIDKSYIFFPYQRLDYRFKWQAFDFKDLQNLQRKLIVTITCLLLNSCWALARRLIVESHPRILSDTSVRAAGPLGSILVNSRIPYIEDHLCSAVEAVALTTVGLRNKPLRKAIEFMMYDVDITRVVLMCIGLHFHPCGHHACPMEEDGTKCYKIQLLQEYDSRRESTAYRLTPLQLAVLCWDYVATQVLLGGGNDPNGLGSVSGESVPIHIYEVDDSWGMASPLHILRHAGYALESIDGQLGIMEKRRAFRDKIEALLISYGGTEFVQLPSQEA